MLLFVMSSVSVVSGCFIVMSSLSGVADYIKTGSFLLVGVKVKFDIYG